MSAISLRLPSYLHDLLRQVAKKEQISINHFATLALTEKAAALMTEDYLEKRAQRGSKKKFLKVLSKIPNRPPDSRDRLD